MSVQEITADAFKKILEDHHNVAVLDVRTPAEYEEESLSVRCLHVTLQDLDAEAFANAHRQQIGDSPLYILCKGGIRARQAAQKLAEHLDNIVVVSGGLNACRDCGIETQRPLVTDTAKNPCCAIPQERQTRILAGFLVLFGVFLAQWVHTDFIYFSTLIGAGLIFGGITGYCGMAMLIARAPWNR